MTLRDRRADFLVRYVQFLREAFRWVRHAQPFDPDAVVVMPDHLHSILTLLEGDANYSHRWRLIKAHFARGLATGIPLFLLPRPVVFVVFTLASANAEFGRQ